MKKNKKIEPEIEQKSSLTDYINLLIFMNADLHIKRLRTEHLRLKLKLFTHQNLLNKKEKNKINKRIVKLEGEARNIYHYDLKKYDCLTLPFEDLKKMLKNTQNL